MIKDKVLEIIKNQFNDQEVILDKKLEDQNGIDSIELLDFVMTLEEEFDIEFSDEELDNAKTLNDIIDLVGVKTGEK